jgi:hypothetical protein
MNRHDRSHRLVERLLDDGKSRGRAATARPQTGSDELVAAGITIEDTPSCTLEFD